MKSIFTVLVFCALVCPAFTQETKTNASPDLVRSTNKIDQAIATFNAGEGIITSPFALTNGILSQPEMTEVTDGGKAVFSFTLTNAGTYVVVGLVNAVDDSSNSFFVNVDTQPEEQMIWDIDQTTGFEERTANWRGNGAADSGEFVPKKFKLAAGAHKLIVVGREPAQLKSLSIRLAAE